MSLKYYKEIYYIAVFDSRNHAVQLYNHLKKMKVDQFHLVPTPCVLKVGCSYSIQFDELDHYPILAREAEKIGKKINGVYEAKRVNNKRVLKKLELNERNSLSY